MITINDSTIEEIREIRHQISQKNDHDPYKLINYYLELQKEYQNQQKYLQESSKK
jgi:hypothetical protein